MIHCTRWCVFVVVQRWPYMALLRRDAVLVLRVFQTESCCVSAGVTVQAKSFTDVVISLLYSVSDFQITFVWCTPGHA